MKVTEIRRIDDKMIFSLNDDIDLNNIYMSGNREDCEKKDSFSLDWTKKQWPNNLHQGYSKECLLRDYNSFTVNKEIYDNIEEFIREVGYNHVQSQEGMRYLRYKHYKDHFDFEGYFREEGASFESSFILTFFDDKRVEVEYTNEY